MNPGGSDRAALCAKIGGFAVTELLMASACNNSSAGARTGLHIVAHYEVGLALTHLQISLSEPDGPEVVDPFNASPENGELADDQESVNVFLPDRLVGMTLTVGVTGKRADESVVTRTSRAACARRQQLKHPPSP